MLLLVNAAIILHLSYLNNNVMQVLIPQQEFVRPRWPYDMWPSVRAKKYMCVIVIARWRDVTLGNDNGTDRQTDRQSATQYAAPS